MNRFGLTRSRARVIMMLVSAFVTPGIAAPAWAQQAGVTHEMKFAPQSTFYGELFGSAVVYSLNYDYRATRNLALRAGFAGWGGSGGALGIFPFTASGLIGKGKNSFEFGGGPVFLAGTGDLQDFDTHVFGSAFVAFRMQPPEGGFFFRAGIGPLFNNNSFLIWPVLSFGVSF